MLGIFVGASMPTVPITFVDGAGSPTNDYVNGWPVVWVNIEVGFVMPSDPSEKFDFKFTRVRALIDTGADYVVISPSLASQLPPTRQIASHSMLGQGYSAVYEALLQVEGLDKPYHIEVGTAPLKSVKVSLGRHIISKYRLIYDTPRQDFRLEL
jgi:predicted aspartyl protease